MNFNQLVAHIKSNGCRVRLYKDRKTISGDVGTFYIAEKGPLITLALQGHPYKKRLEYLLHEFGHFYQWKDGFMDILDNICDAWYLWERWIDRKIELSHIEKKAVRNTILAIEWDAEERVLNLAKNLDITDFDVNHHLQGANSYVLAVKWSFKHRKNFESSPKRKLVQPRLLTKNELFAPLSKNEKEILSSFNGQS